jgi:glycosyltransferase involved in cell wall biosynthesis
VLTIHGNMRLIAAVNHAPMISFYRMAATLEALVLPRTDGVVCITKYTQDAVKDLARKTWVRPNAVDASFFNIEPAPDPVRFILLAGVICLRKNQNAFIRAMDDLAATHKFKIIFLGVPSPGDPYAAEFFELLKTRTWCEFVGFVSRDALKNWLQRATMLALPSLEDNCPMVVLEAMAARVPVVAANVGGVPELVSDNQTGLLCDPLNAASMREGVRKILDDDALVKSLTTTAKDQAIAKYHPLTIAREHVKIYKEVLSSRGK